MGKIENLPYKYGNLLNFIVTYGINIYDTLKKLRTGKPLALIPILS